MSSFPSRLRCSSCSFSISLRAFSCASRCASSADVSPFWILSTISGSHSYVFFSPYAPTQPAIPACPSIFPVSMMLSSIRFWISDFCFSLLSSVSARIASISAPIFSCSRFIFSFCSLVCSFLSSAPSVSFLILSASASIFSISASCLVHIFYSFLIPDIGT